MNTNTAWIARELREAFSGEPWFGYPLRQLLAGVAPEAALARASDATHNIWELVLHIELWARITLDATNSVPMPRLWGTEEDWPSPGDAGPEDWERAQTELFVTIEKLAAAMEAFPDSRLNDKVPGRDYTFAYLFNGIVQHSIYHFGQIAMSKAAARTALTP